MKSYRKSETKKYAWTINYVRDEIANGRDFWASMGSAGITFTDELERFCRYASQVGAHDISEPLLEKHPEWI